MFAGEKVTVIMAAAGSGSRMGGGRPKQFLPLDGRTVLEAAIAPFAACDAVDDILVLAHPDFVAETKTLCGDIPKVREVLSGSRQSRQASVARAVSALEGDGLVLVHDAARPFVTEAIILRVLEATRRTGAAVPAAPVKDTVRRLTPAAGAPGAPRAAVSSQTLPRGSLYAVQTPQGFRCQLLREAYAAAERDGVTATDDAFLVERLGRPVEMVAGSYANIKITTKEDLPVEARVGTGFDVHRLVEGRPLILGGIEVPFDRGLLGHSDADVLTHALMDAMLGAAGLGDIGRHFPDMDPRYEGISSLRLLEMTAKKIEAAGYALGNADVTVIAQAPRLSPYIEAMEEALADALRVRRTCIHIKATTTEGLGYTGHGEGIAAEAVCLLKPGPPAAPCTIHR